MMHGAHQAEPVLSIVVIGRNEGERLRRCLESIRAMQSDAIPSEVIYVDSGSVDGSVALAEMCGARTISLQPKRPSAALGRNAGWRAARGEMVLCLDGDTILAPEFVARALPEFEDAEIAVVWGHRRELYPKSSLYIRALDLDWIYAPGRTRYCGGDAIFRRSVLQSTSGFDEGLIAGEEPELCRRIEASGYAILHIDCAMTGHDLAITRWGQYWKRSTRAGHAFAEVSERYKDAEYPFWVAEADRNRKRVGQLALLLVVTIAGCVLLRSVLPLIAGACVFAFLAARSAWKARWKTDDWIALALYGVHSHVQQIPIYVGQLQYRWNRQKGKRSMLFEYKQP
jgi:glycosyltransferase involved in cell wall biosynthesis